MRTKFFCAGDLREARVLVIGHDPRLQRSDTQSQYAFFADYYFRPIPTQRSELQKYKLAQAVFSYVAYLISSRYSPDKLVLTNLCNTALPHAPKRKTVLIPQQEARAGISAIRDILHQSSVEVVFAMSLQVNYWLQKLGFYPPVPEFLRAAEPAPRGLKHEPPYYEARRGRAFQLICGKCFNVDGRRVIPILHVKNWPLRGVFKKAYAQAYEDCVNDVNSLYTPGSQQPGA